MYIAHSMVGQDMYTAPMAQDSAVGQDMCIAHSRTRDSAVGQDMYIAHSRTRDSAVG